ncbi:MAG: YdcF family protein [Acidobacteria bacterium]|nr:YdcF family protein [Acidobacteriota bacterium]
MGWVFLLGLAAAVARSAARPRLAAGLWAAAWLLAVAASLPVTASVLDGGLAGLERRWPPAPAWAPASAPDAILVFSGGVDGFGPQALLTRASIERVDAALEAAARWPGVPLVFSGGAPGGAPASGRLMAARALACGLEPRVAIVEDRARSTRDNAVRCAELARARGWQRLALVTSPGHMARSRAALWREGFLAAALPAPSGGALPGGAQAVLPGASALERVTGGVHEAIGLGYYWARGWLGEPESRRWSAGSQLAVK